MRSLPCTTMTRSSSRAPAPSPASPSPQPQRPAKVLPGVNVNPSAVTGSNEWKRWHSWRWENTEKRENTDRSSMSLTDQFLQGGLQQPLDGETVKYSLYNAFRGWRQLKFSCQMKLFPHYNHICFVPNSSEKFKLFNKVINKEQLISH
jgi:hypothetical protein